MLTILLNIMKSPLSAHLWYARLCIEGAVAAKSRRYLCAC